VLIAGEDDEMLQTELSSYIYQLQLYGVDVVADLTLVWLYYVIVCWIW